MLEQKKQKLAPVHVFVKRVAWHTLVVVLLLVSALSVGVAGYHWIAGFSWVDSLLNASMILGGMGEINLLTNTSAKIFASIYALFSGLVFIVCMGVFFMPIMHRILHMFHMEE